MKYLALGDSTSIDKYTGIESGGAVNQFARLIGAENLHDLTHDGYTTNAVIESLATVNIKPDIITITVGGNDLLQRSLWNIDRYTLSDPGAAKTLSNLQHIYSLLSAFNCAVIVNTIHDPTDGNEVLMQQLGMSAKFRIAYDEINQTIRKIADEYGFILSDLQLLFSGHGIKSTDTWVTMEIEPNYAGATAISSHWYKLLQTSNSAPALY